MDFLDIINGKFNETLPAVYYGRKKPERIAVIKNADDLYKINVGEPFDYEIISPNTYHYRQLLSNIMSDGATLAIKSKNQLNWQTKGYVTLADGKTYIIDTVTEDMSEVPKEAMRIFPVPVGTDYILTLTQYDIGV